MIYTFCWWVQHNWPIVIAYTAIEPNVPIIIPMVQQLLN